MVKLEREIVSGDQLIISQEKGGCTLAFCDKQGTPIRQVSNYESDSKLWLNIANGSAVIPLVSLMLGREFRRLPAFSPHLTCFEVR